MKATKSFFAGLAALTLVAGATAAAERSTNPVVPKVEQTVVFSGGCFWGIQSVFEHTKGVISAVSGYAGGSFDRPSYEQVSSGTTGHAESVKVTFDTTQITFGQLMKIFFTVAHDPTELNRQGPDAGTQYRSMLQFTTPDQERQAKAYIDELNKSHVFKGPIVTQVVQLKTFYPAEAYHQHYAELHPDQPYIVYNDAPKVANLKREFPQFYHEYRAN